MIQTITLLAVVLVLGTVAYFRSSDALPWVLGILLGISCNLLKVLMLDTTVTKLSTLDSSEASKYIISQQVLRLMLSAMVLLVAVFIPFINVLGTALGILTFQVATLLVGRSTNTNLSSDVMNTKKQEDL